MSYVFGNPGASKGCFKVVNIDTSASRGAQLILPDGVPLPDGIADPYLVTRVDIGLQEDRFVSKNIGDVNFLYAFGHNATASQAVVTLVSIMYGRFEGGGAGGATLATLLDAYAQNRVWKESEQALLMLEGRVAASGFIDSLTSSTQDAGANLQAVSFRMLIPQAAAGSLPSIPMGTGGFQA